MDLMQFRTLLIVGSDAASVRAIRERIPDDGYLVHTVLGDVGRLSRLLDCGHRHRRRRRRSRGRATWNYPAAYVGK